jgi:ferredoxin
MAVEITDICIKCGACEWECPTEAIVPGTLRPVVIQDSCTECRGFFGESQCIVACPADAIVVHAESVMELDRKYMNQVHDRDPVDISIWRRIGTLVCG